jgi:hypothetical protein
MTTGADLSQHKPNTDQFLPAMQKMNNNYERTANADRNNKVSVQEMNTYTKLQQSKMKLGKLKRRDHTSEFRQGISTINRERIMRQQIKQ